MQYPAVITVGKAYSCLKLLGKPTEAARISKAQQQQFPALQKQEQLCLSTLKRNLGEDKLAAIPK